MPKIKIKAKNRRRSIRNKILTVLVGTALLSLVPFGQVAFRGLYGIRSQMQHSSAQLGEFAAKNSSAFLEREAVDKLMTRAKDQALFINERLVSIAKDAVYFADHVTEIYKTADRLAPVYIPYPSSANQGKLAMQLVSANGKADYPRIKKEAGTLGNVSSAFVSNSSDMEAVTVAVYLATESGFAIVYDPFSSDDNRSFDPRGRNWYVGARERGGTFWTEPYFDVASGKLIVTCSNPFYGAGGEFRGVIGIDVVIDDLNNEIINIDMGENGYAFVVSASGTVISSKELEKRGEDGVYEKKSAFMENNREYNGVIRKMTLGETGFAKVNTDSGERYMAYAAIPVTRWSVAIARPVSEVMGVVAENSEAIEEMTQKTLFSVNSAIRETLIVFAVMFAAVSLTVLYLARMFTAKISKPIIVLENGLKRIAGGELDIEIDIKTGDEIERLGYSVNAMARELKEYIANLQRVTAEKERIGAELNVAAKIQANMLPSIFPPFPNRPEFDIYASMVPAREVGGDFYDFFFVDEDTLAVVVADVSGKGVPAALFMVIAKTLIKNNAQAGLCPREVFERVNNILCEGNDAGMFVTAFMGYLDTKTGKFTYVNAGHNPPILRSNGACGFIYTEPGFVLAGLENTRFKEGEIALRPGDELFLYTDGITEAANREEAMFGKSRLIGVADSRMGLPPHEFAASIMQEIDKFAAGAEQADDITMLLLKFKK